MVAAVNNAISPVCDAPEKRRVLREVTTKWNKEFAGRNEPLFQLAVNLHNAISDNDLGDYRNGWISDCVFRQFSQIAIILCSSLWPLSSLGSMVFCLRCSRRT